MDEDFKAVVTIGMANYAQAALVCPGNEDGVVVFQRLVLKLLGEIQSKEPSAEMSFPKEELWMLQTIAKPFAEYGKGEKVGLAWLEIVAEGLLHLEAETEVHQAVMRYGESDKEEESQETIKGKIAQMQEEVASDG